MATVRIVVKWTKPVAGFRCLDCETIRPGGAPNICRCSLAHRRVGPEQVDVNVRRAAYVVSIPWIDAVGPAGPDRDRVKLGPWVEF